MTFTPILNLSATDRAVNAIAALEDTDTKDFYRGAARQEMLEAFKQAYAQDRVSCSGCSADLTGKPYYQGSDHGQYCQACRDKKSKK